MERAVLQTAASQFIGSYGPAAESMLRVRADMAAERGHLIAASTWRELADATAMIGTDGQITEPVDCQENEVPVLATAIRRFSSEFRPSWHRITPAR